MVTVQDQVDRLLEVVEAKQLELLEKVPGAVAEQVLSRCEVGGAIAVTQQDLQGAIDSLYERFARKFGIISLGYATEALV